MRRAAAAVVPAALLLAAVAACGPASEMTVAQAGTAFLGAVCPAGAAAAAIESLVEAWPGSAEALADY